MGVASFYLKKAGKPFSSIIAIRFSVLGDFQNKTMLPLG